MILFTDSSFVTSAGNNSNYKVQEIVHMSDSTWMQKLGVSQESYMGGVPLHSLTPKPYINPPLSYGGKFWVA